MPFIKPERRKIINESGLGLHGLAIVEPGDRCYVFYKPMVEKWKANPRWTTAHEILKDLGYRDNRNDTLDDHVARQLAWEVFFQLHVMPYELKKREENGDI